WRYQSIMRRDAFQAIADPTRRDILTLLDRQPLRLHEIATHFDISRPAVSKHIKILVECGLVEIIEEGRERYCHARLADIQSVFEWSLQYRKYWSNKIK